MADFPVGPEHFGGRSHNWKGGRSIASNGYVLIRVGREHHLADVRGYAYEHRLVAEEKIGRRLSPGEIVHHLDDNKQNNDPANLEVMPSIGHHRYEHRKRESGRRAPGGESGADRRPSEVGWQQALADQCAAAGVPFYEKQDTALRAGQQGRIPDALWARKEVPGGC